MLQCLGSQECLFLPVEIPSNEVQENQKSSVSFNKVEDIKEKWVGSHCRNLARMIPGGVRISGICLTLPHSEFTGHIEHIKKFPHWQRASSSSSLESGASSDTNMNNGNDTSGSSSSFVSINRLLISGRIPGIAFLPVNSNVGDLLEALRKDLIRSVLVRLQLLTEELHITSAELEVPRMMLPQRVLVRLPPCPTLPLSDYKFLSETPEDVVNRLVYFCSPLGTTVSSDSVNLGISHSASDNSLTDVESTPQIPSSDDRIDASCLDTTLEKTPESKLSKKYLSL
ncbi:unnamed protein product [Trichobilharzia regenti]|nr:unnamed protein product [Trichobilharzia regenti]